MHTARLETASLPRRRSDRRCSSWSLAPRFAIGVAASRGADARRAVGAARMTRRFFAAGLAVLAVTLSGPLDAWSERSFADHMIQHELLMLAAAPLLVLGRPLAHWAWALPRGARVGVVRLGPESPVRPRGVLLTGVTGACALQTAGAVGLASPRVVRAALEHPGSTHPAARDVSRGRAVLLVERFAPGTARQQASRGIASLFVTMLDDRRARRIADVRRSAAGTHDPDRVPPFGLTPLEDQQVGGLLMWIPGGTVYVVDRARARRAGAARGAGSCRMRAGAAPRVRWSRP